MSSQNVTILDGAHAGVKSHLKEQVGQGFSAAFPQRTRNIYRSPDAGRGGVIDRGILHYLRQRSVREKRDRFLARLQASFWQGDGGAAFAENCDYRFRDYFLKHQQQDFATLRSVWQREESIRNIVEIGTCSGLLLEYLTTELPGVERAVGIDINQTQIDRNRHRFADTDLQFHCGDGLRWVQENAESGTLFVSNGGVLEYFSRQNLEAFVSHAATDLSPSIFFCSEPIAADHDLDTQKDSLPFGEEYSFSHNYPEIFRAAGLLVVSQRETQCEQYRMLATVAVTQ